MAEVSELRCKSTLISHAIRPLNLTNHAPPNAFAFNMVADPITES